MIAKSITTLKENRKITFQYDLNTTFAFSHIDTTYYNYLYSFYLFPGTLLTLGICLWNVRHMNNYMQMHSALTISAAACIIFYRISTGSLQTPIEGIKTWDPSIIVNVFWALLIAQFIFEVLTYTGLFKLCGFKPDGTKFVYNKPKAKTEDYFYDEMSEPWNLDNIKLKLARSMSHMMYNDLMLIVILLMRPHNVVLVPSVHFTCHLTSKCLSHKLLDARSSRRKDAVDTLSKALAHLWIGVLFFFYQVGFLGGFY